MSKINILKESNNKVSKDTIISLMSDLLLKKLDQVMDYNPSQTYYKEDLIYRFTEGRHEILQCLEDGVSGDFNYDKWADLTLSMSSLANGRSIDDELIYLRLISFKALEDGTNSIDISSVPNMKETNTNAILMHSVRGIIPRGEFVIDENAREIKLTGWDMNAGEVAKVLIFRFGKPASRNTPGYSNIYEQKITVENKVQDYYPITIPSFNKDEDFILVIHSMDGMLEYGIDYNFVTQGIRLTNQLQPGQFASIIAFQQRPGDGYNNLLYGVSKFDSEDPVAECPIPINGFVKGRDKLFVFDRVNGYLGEHQYSISEDGKTISFVDMQFIVNEEIIFAALTESSTLMLPDDFLDVNHFSYNVRGHLSPLLGEVLLTFKNPSVLVDIPKGTFLNNNYNVNPEIVQSSGDVGSIIIKNKTMDSFAIEMTGIASKVKVQYSITPAN